MSEAWNSKGRFTRSGFWSQLLLKSKAYERVEAVVSRIVQWDNAGIYRHRFVLLFKYIISQ